ncbi:MAG: flippase-like domain-containing protein [Bacteroidales bacterium]|nr:flippase-like domain-containing protein [Bacteroidales bacterium]
MNSKIKKALQIIIFFAIGIGLFWLAYRGQDIDSMIFALKNTKWGWIIAIAILCLVGHYCRALRWELLLEPSGYKPRKINLFISVLVMYLSNMAIPRSGEVFRCGMITKYEKIPFAESLGTVVTERIVDLVMLFIITIAVLICQTGIVSEIIANNPDIATRIETIKDYIPYIIVATILLIVLSIFIIKIMIKRNVFGIGEKIKGLWNSFKNGMTTVLHLKQRVLFIFYTIFIYFVYFYTIYLGFQAFEFTEHLSLMTALTVFVLGTFGVVVPSPGGMGTWHFIVIETLSLFGINKDPDGRAFALVIHGLQDITFLFLGVISLLILPIINKNYQPKEVYIENKE